MPFPLTFSAADGSESWNRTAPTQWADVSLGTFVELVASDASDRKPVEVLLDLPEGVLERLSVQTVAYLTNLLAFALDLSPVLELLPTPGLPDIGTLSYGTWLLAQQYLEANPGKPRLAYGPYLLALYRMQLLWGKYDAAKVAACEAALLAGPVTEAYADACFFLTSYKRLLSATPPTPTTTPSPKTRSWRQAVKSWGRGLARCSTSMRRQRAPS